MPSEPCKISAREAISTRVERDGFTLVEPLAIIIHSLKLGAFQMGETAAVMSAMQCCGLAGYRNDGEFSIGRHLRDILSSPIMISNDRILANAATASLVSGIPDSLAN